MQIKVFAPAKVNLALHVTGQRPDGYHLLDTLVGFASVGDWVTLDRTTPRSLTIGGPEGAALDPEAPNLVMQTAMAFWDKGMGPLGLHLEKHLPISSGIGGGSADAAATFRGILWLKDQMKQPEPMDPALAARLLALGADVPMCVQCEPARVRGIGEQIEPLPLFAKVPVVLVNPRCAVSTPSVFKALTAKDNAPLPELPADLDNVAALFSYLADQRNDLQTAAIGLAPVIGKVLDEIAASGNCRLARMSGSGATCFGLYPDQQSADAAAEQIAGANPGWWVRAGVLDGQDRAAPFAVN